MPKKDDHQDVRNQDTRYPAELDQQERARVAEQDRQEQERAEQNRTVDRQAPRMTPAEQDQEAKNRVVEHRNKSMEEQRAKDEQAKVEADAKLTPEQRDMKRLLKELHDAVLSLQLRPEDRVKFTEIEERISRLAGIPD